MSTANLAKCGCCGDDGDEETLTMDIDLDTRVCPACRISLQWAHAQLRRRTTTGISITGIHGPREKPVPYDPRLSQAELDKLNKEGK